MRGRNKDKNSVNARLLTDSLQITQMLTGLKAERSEECAGRAGSVFDKDTPPYNLIKTLFPIIFLLFDRFFYMQSLGTVDVLIP